MTRESDFCLGPGISRHYELRIQVDGSASFSDQQTSFRQQQGHGLEAGKVIWSES